jgi:hypothetical protein
MTLEVITAARRRTRRRLTIAVLIGVGVVAALVYPAGLYVNAHLNDEAVSSPATAAPPSPAASATATAPGVALPAEVTWVRVAGVDLPTSLATGPAQTVGGLARGFAHTPAGAVVAAVHLLVRTTPDVGPAVFEPTLTGQVVGEHAAAMRRTVADVYTQAAAEQGVAYGQPLGDLHATVAGIRVDTYTPLQATLSVLTSAVDTTGVTRYAATTVTLSWTNGDWLLVAPPDGRWDSQVRLLDPASIGGYPPLRAR